MAQYFNIIKIGLDLSLIFTIRGGSRLEKDGPVTALSSSKVIMNQFDDFRTSRKKKCDVVKWKARVSQPVVALSNEWRENCRRSIQSGTPCRCQRAKNEAVLQLFVSSTDIREVHQLNLKLDNYVVNHMGYKSSSLGVRWVLILNLKNFSALSLES